MALRNWRRLAVAALGLALALTLFAYYQVMIAGITATVQKVATRRLYPADIVVRAPDALPEAVLTQIRNSPSVDGVITIAEQSITTDAGPITLLKLNVLVTEMDLGDVVVAGRLPQSIAEGCLSDRTAQELGLSVGSQIRVPGSADSTFTVTGLLDDTRPIPRPSVSSAHGLITHQPDPAEPNSAWVTLKSPGEAASLSQLWSRDFAAFGGYAMAPNQDPTGVAPPGITESLVRTMSILLVVAVGVFLGNLLYVNMLGRKKEYDALHVLGLPLDDLVLFPLTEAFLVALGALPGLTAAWLIILPRIVPTGARFRAALTPGVLGIAALLGVLVAVTTGVLAGVLIHRSRAS
jgi:hypothetical protein